MELQTEITKPFVPFIDTEVEEKQGIEVNKRETRWIVLAGDATSPTFKRNFDGAQLGGIYLGDSYKTLKLSKKLLLRCQLTPMVVASDDLNADSLGDERDKYKSRTVRALAHNDPDNPNKTATTTIFYNECLPADELAGIMSTFQGARDIGIREVASLKGIEPPRKDNPECVALDYQKEIFPDWGDYLSGKKEFFATNNQLQTYLLERKSVVSVGASQVIDVLLESNVQFDRWATSELDRMGRLVKAPPVDGKVYSWEPIHHQHFDYTGLNKDEFLMSRRGEDATSEVSREEFNEMRGMLAEVTGILKPLAQAAVVGIKPDYSGKVCADVNGKDEPCGSKVSKEIDGKFFCHNHPKELKNESSGNEFTN